MFLSSLVFIVISWAFLSPFNLSLINTVKSSLGVVLGFLSIPPYHPSSCPPAPSLIPPSPLISQSSCTHHRLLSNPARIVFCFPRIQIKTFQSKFAYKVTMIFEIQSVKSFEIRRIAGRSLHGSDEKLFQNHCELVPDKKNSTPLLVGSREKLSTRQCLRGTRLGQGLGKYIKRLCHRCRIGLDKHTRRPRAISFGMVQPFGKYSFTHRKAIFQV